MYARIWTVELEPALIEEATRRLRERILPAAREQPGYGGALALLDRSTGKSLVVTFWDTPDHLTASESDGLVGAQLATATQHLKSAMVRETYEVVHEERVALDGPPLAADEGAARLGG